jgi:hypothetical protein
MKRSTIDRTARRRRLEAAIVVSVAVMICGIASPALGINVVFTAPNTAVTLGVAYSALEFDNPLTGTETVAGYRLEEWRDAGWECPTSPTTEDWTVTGACTTCPPSGGCADGYYNEIWLRTAGHSATATTSVATSVVSIHLYGDNNDGMADVVVDGILVATLDMWTSTTDTALVIVTGLPQTTHTLQVLDQGVTQQPGGSGDDIAIMGAAALRPSFDPQPYLVYEVPPEPVAPPALVDLEDQFNLWTDVSVMDRWFHMNPVDKIPLSPPGDPELIMDPDLHYRWFTIHTQAGSQPGTRTVQVTNQFAFGDLWEISQVPEFLLAPASKIIGPGEPGPPPPGQHYDCYAVLAAPPWMAVVDLLDQFGPHEPTDVLDARYLCAPVEKTTEGGTVYPIFEATNGRDHLACYDLLPEPWSELITTRDQFTDISPNEGLVVEERMLCVPTLKTYERVPSLAPWGIATLGLAMLLTVFWVAQRRARGARGA